MPVLHSPEIIRFAEAEWGELNTVKKIALIAVTFLYCWNLNATEPPADEPLADEPLATEEMGRVATLPVPYPRHWVIAHDAAFFHMSDGKFVLLDPLADSQAEQFKGMFNGSNIAAFAQATRRPEMYVAETFYARGNRGARTDVVTIYDRSTLSPVAEVVLPGAKRSSHMPEKHAFQIVDQERLGLVYNFTPAASVTVVDLVKRVVLSEVSIAGCALIYPTGKRGFSSWCNNGAMLSIQLTANGNIAASSRTEPVFDPEADALFEKPALYGGVAYFPSLQGEIQPMNLKGEAAQPEQSWWLTSQQEREEGWRPGGWQLLDVDATGKMYILMHPDGKEGSHKDPGSEVWVYDLAEQKRLNRIALNNWGISVALTRTPEPLLLVTTAEMGVDVYDVNSSSFLRSLSFGQETPFVIHAVP